MNPPRYGQAEPRVSFPPPIRSRTAALAAVPDPRFRDQLAEALIDARLIRWREVDMALEYIDALMPAIAAEVEARVQAAAKDAVERAAQAVEALRPHIPPSTDPNRRTAVIVRSTLNRAARAARADALAAASQPTDGRTGI